MLTLEGRKRQLAITRRAIIGDLQEIGILKAADVHVVHKVGMVLDSALVHLINRVLDFEEERGVRKMA